MSAEFAQSLLLFTLAGGAIGLVLGYVWDYHITPRIQEWRDHDKTL